MPCRLPILAISTTLLIGCSPRLIALRSMTPLLERGAQAYYEEPDPVLGRDSLSSQLKLLEALLKNDPHNPKLLYLTAQGFGGYAFLFLEDAEPERAREFYRRGKEWGLRLVNQNPTLRSIDSMTLERLEGALSRAGPQDVPGLFWTAYNWAGWINLSKDSPDAVAGLPKVAAVMRRIEELSPGYYYGGPDLFLGSYYASIPRMLGGDPAKSKEHFEAAVRRTAGRFLIAKVLYAQYYCVAAQDDALFRRLIEEVAAAQVDFPQVQLANAVAKIKSKRLLGRVHELF